MKLGAYQPTCMIQLGEAYLLAGRLEDALDLAERALAFTRERGQRPHEAWALRLLGEVTARCDPSERADGHFRDALARAAGAGDAPPRRPLPPRPRPAPRADRATVERAREHLSTATAMFREMGMKFWLEKAEAAMP